MCSRFCSALWDKLNALYKVQYSQRAAQNGGFWENMSPTMSTLPDKHEAFSFSILSIKTAVLEGILRLQPGMKVLQLILFEVTSIQPHEGEINEFGPRIDANRGD